MGGKEQNPSPASWLSHDISVHSNQAVLLLWAGPHTPPSPIFKTQSGVTQNITVNESAYYQWGEQTGNRSVAWMT